VTAAGPFRTHYPREGTKSLLHAIAVLLLVSFFTYDHPTGLLWRISLAFFPGQLHVFQAIRQIICPLHSLTDIKRPNSSP